MRYGPQSVPVDVTVPIPYESFIDAKAVTGHSAGFEVDLSEINPSLKPITQIMAQWAVRGGKRAIFAKFGLHKTTTQLEIMRLIGNCHPDMFRLIILPLGVIHEFKRDAGDYFTGSYGIKLKFIRRAEEIEGPDVIYLTNYESVREGILDVSRFEAISLDEAAVLRSFGGTKTFREFMDLFEYGVARYKFVATATPSPNDFVEILAYAAFLNIMDVGQAKTRFFQRDSEKADNLTLRPNKEEEFLLWCSEWGLFVQSPSDLGLSDEGYILPDFEIHWHEIPSDYSSAGHETSGQGRLYPDTAIGITHAAREKRRSMLSRMSKLMELRSIEPEAHRVLWHDLEDERTTLESMIPSLATVYGKQDLEDRERILLDFSDGKIQEIGGKPSMLGCGNNFQRHCWWAIYPGISFDFHDFIQSLYRLLRYGQKHPVRIDLIYTEAERHVQKTLIRKWDQHNRLMAKMSAIIREYGLAQNALHGELKRNKAETRAVVASERYTLANNDCILELRDNTLVPSDSVHLILTSIPFATQYEYCSLYNDFGHCDSNEHFFRQMDYLTPNLFRVLKPGRVAAIHVKDRIVPGGITGLGFQSVYPFHADVIYHFTKHGFSFLGMKTIVTDVVRENNQTYRLGWSEQCKDGSRMGAGLPEYLLLFRKPQTDRSKGYADEPVAKDKASYSRHRWQVDAHGFMRSSGDRLLTADNISGLPHHVIFKLFRERFSREVYDYEKHVQLGEALEVCSHCSHIHLGIKEDDDEGKVCGRRENGERCDCSIYESSLPKKFMLLQPPSWHPEVWTDIARMRTLNGAQAAQGKEQHLCPLQFDIIKRVVTQFSMPGELILDPFNGIGSVTSETVKLGRRAYGIELNPQYHEDAIYYTKAAEDKLATPSLFGLLEAEEGESEECPTAT